MKIIIAGKPEEVADSYALRLIEQGKAVPAPKVHSPKAEKGKGKAVVRDGAEGQDRA